MESIRSWLDGGREYAAGAKLYQLYGKDKLLKRLFAEKEITDFKRKRLLEEMWALVEPAKDSAGLQQDSPVNEPVSDKTHISGWRRERDEVEQALYLKWHPLFTELNNLCSRIGDIARAGAKAPLQKKEAHRMALKIVELDEKCDALYRQRDHYLSSGSIPEEFPYGPPCEDPLLLPLALQKHQRYLREYKGKLKRKPEDLNIAKQIKKQEWFVDYYKKILKLK